MPRISYSRELAEGGPYQVDLIRVNQLMSTNRRSYLQARYNILDPNDQSNHLLTDNMFYQHYYSAINEFTASVEAALHDQIELNKTYHLGGFAMLQYMSGYPHLSGFRWYTLDGVKLSGGKNG